MKNGLKKTIKEEIQSVLKAGKKSKPKKEPEAILSKETEIEIDRQTDAPIEQSALIVTQQQSSKLSAKLIGSEAKRSETSATVGMDEGRFSMIFAEIE
jgi:hypothetical protein